MSSGCARSLCRGLRILGSGVVLFFGVVTVGGAWAQEARRVGDVPVAHAHTFSDWQDCGLRKGEIDAFVFHRPLKRKQHEKSANIRVVYDSGIPTAAQEAYERAVEIWEYHVASTVDIRIRVGRIEDPSEDVLGGTIPASFWVLERRSGTRFIAGSALADALTGQDAEPDTVDMLTDFNFERDDWHFEQEPAPSGQIDFTSVVLHEIAHGLHYLSLCRYNPNGGQCAFEVSNGGRVSGIFTHRLYEHASPDSFIAVTNETEYPTTAALGQALTSERLVFDGDRSRRGAEVDVGPVPPKIYAPANFDPGSSLSHLDENTYPFEGRDALMTPRIAPAETNRLPGPVVCGQLADLGWPLGSACGQYFQDVFGLQFAGRGTPPQAGPTLTWEVRDDAEIREYVVEREYFDEGFEPLMDGIEGPPVHIEDLGLGRFAFRVRWIREDGTESVSDRHLNTTINIRNFTAEVVSTDEQGRGTVDVSWDVPSATSSRFTYRVERAPATGEVFEVVTTGGRQQFTAENQLPGQYNYRVVSKDGQGNRLVSTVAPVDVQFDGPVYVRGPFPNPARNRSTIVLTAKDPQGVSVQVYNALGERIFLGEHELRRQVPTRISFDSGRWSSGVYYIRVSGRTFTETRKLVVVH